MISYSGICVMTRPDACATLETELARLEGVEVYASDHQTSKIVVVQEAEARDDHEQGLRRIRDLPGVLTADLVYHFVDNGLAAVPTDSV